MKLMLQSVTIFFLTTLLTICSSNAAQCSIVPALTEEQQMAKAELERRHLGLFFREAYCDRAHLRYENPSAEFIVRGIKLGLECDRIIQELDGKTTACEFTFDVQDTTRRSSMDYRLRFTRATLLHKATELYLHPTSLKAVAALIDRLIINRKISSTPHAVSADNPAYTLVDVYKLRRETLARDFQAKCYDDSVKVVFSEDPNFWK